MPGILSFLPSILVILPVEQNQMEEKKVRSDSTAFSSYIWRNFDLPFRVNKLFSPSMDLLMKVWHTRAESDGNRD
jgi:hypothetical protein